MKLISAETSISASQEAADYLREGFRACLDSLWSKYQLKPAFQPAKKLLTALEKDSGHAWSLYGANIS